MNPSKAESQPSEVAIGRRTLIRTLETERLILRPLCESDAPRTQLLFPDPEVLRFMTAAIPWPYPEDGAISYIRSVLPKVASGDIYHWTIVQKADPEQLLIGRISLMPHDRKNSRGFWLTPEFWGRGYMSEASRRINNFAFDEIGVNLLHLNNAVPNVPSRKLKERSGAKLIDIVPSEPFFGGEFPMERWVLTAEDWRANR